MAITSVLLTCVLLGEFILMFFLEFVSVPSNLAEIGRISVDVSYCLDLAL